MSISSLRNYRLVAGTLQAYSSVGSVTTIICVVLQIFLFLFLGGVADFGGWRKFMLTACTVITAVFTGITFFGAGIKDYEFNSVCLIIASSFMNLGCIAVNAYLPLLGRNSEYHCTKCSTSTLSTI